MGAKTADTPDYMALAEKTSKSANAAMDKQTWANRIDQFNPWGSITYDSEKVLDPATGKVVTKWTQNQKLNPKSQAALDKQMDLTAQKSDFAGRLMDRAGGTLEQEMDWDKFGGYGEAPLAYGTEFEDIPQMQEGVIGERQVPQMPLSNENTLPIAPEHEMPVSNDLGVPAVPTFKKRRPNPWKDEKEEINRRTIGALRNV